MTAEISKVELKKIKAAFESWDSNKDGVIQKKEIGNAIRAAGKNPCQKEVSQFMEQTDTNKDGVVDFDEFLRMYTGVKKQLPNNAELRDAFAFFDKDGNGKISASELREVMTSYGEPLSEEEAKDLLSMGDKDNDGFLNIEEFIQLMISCD